MRTVQVVLLCAAAALVGGTIASFPQSNPGFYGPSGGKPGMVPTAAQWNSYFAGKQDVLGYTPVNKAGDSMQGLLNAFPSAAASAGFNLGQGSAPTTPNNGDIWITSSGVFVHAGGSTVGPLSAGTSATAGGTSGQVQYNNAGNLGGFTAGGDATINTSTGSVTVTKTNGTNFGALATLGVGTGLISSGGNLSINSPIPASLGGTGVNNGTNTITLSENVGTSGTGGLTMTTTGATNSTFPAGTHSLAALDLADQTISGGANVSNLTLTTGSLTVDCGLRPILAINNTGAFTVTAPVNGGSCILYVLNNSSAGAITFSGFSEGSNTGDALNTVVGDSFSIFIWRIQGGPAGYRVAAHQ